MELFSGWKQRQREKIQQQMQPYNEAQNEIWRREIARLGESEFQRRQDAVADAQLGRTGPSGYEDWDRELQVKIQALALRITGQNNT